MSKCFSCNNFEKCNSKIARDPNSETCPELVLRFCGQCVMFDSCKSCDKGVVSSTEACIRWESSVSNVQYDTIKHLFESSVLPALKDSSYVSDPAVIKNIEYLSRNLGSLINKPSPEDINLERTLMEIIYEDFEIDRALHSASDMVNQILQSEGVNVPFRSKVVESIVNSLSEVKLIYKISLACGLAGYVDKIMDAVINTKFGRVDSQIKR
jgi:hypothetical protein